MKHTILRLLVAAQRSRAMSASDDDLRAKIIQYLEENEHAATPYLPTEYSALMYVALGTLATMHESNMLENEMRIQNDFGPKYMQHIGFLQDIIRILEERQRQT